MSLTETLQGTLKIAYLSMEFCVDPKLPTYSGGLGVLAGDHLKAASDLGVPIIGVGLFYRYGYFEQEISPEGNQIEHYPLVNRQEAGVELIVDEDGNPIETSILIEDREVKIQALLKPVGNVPLVELTTDVAGNTEEDRMITDHLYGAATPWDQQTRVRQEMVLGMGGKRMLDRLGVNIGVYHMNEGHSAFLSLERLEQLMNSGLTTEDALEKIRSNQLFTNHTLVPAGNDIFSGDVLRREFSSHHILDSNFEALRDRANHLTDQPKGSWSQAKFAITTSGKTTAVSKRHSETAATQWGIGQVDYITNGVHISWMDPDIKALVDSDQERFNKSHTDPDYLRERMSQIDPQEFRTLRNRRRKELMEFLSKTTGRSFSPDTLTIGFARRATSYKRLDLIFRDPDRLLHIIRDLDIPIQFVMAAKAHPRDDEGKRTIQKLVKFTQDPTFKNHVLFVPNYNVDIAHHLVTGSDVWLNTPRKGQEASGTSGMKAAENGLLNLSINDGWLGEMPSELYYEIEDDEDDLIVTSRILDMLELQIAPTFYDPDYDKPISPTWILKAMRSMAYVIANFSAARMTAEYNQRFYQPILNHETQLFTL